MALMRANQPETAVNCLPGLLCTHRFSPSLVQNALGTENVLISEVSRFQGLKVTGCGIGTSIWLCLQGNLNELIQYCLVESLPNEAELTDKVGMKALMCKTLGICT